MAEFTINPANSQFETTNFGQRVNNSESLKAGLRGPTLMEDFMMREKIMHFDHERIPERVVHARGVGAHGYFESYGDWSNITAAGFLNAPGKKTPTFTRFSTVLGNKGSSDTVRDDRGFATRFYTDEGNFDLVGNVIPPFFIQDAIKFPDLIHAGKMEPDTDTPQAGTAHETAYDFFAEFPETLHTVMWVLSPRGIPRSLRQVEGFGIHTFRLVTADGNSVFCKFHWKPAQGVSNLLWDEAQKIAGKNSDFHRDDLYTAINRGDFPSWELGVQIIPAEDEFKYDFDLLDPTKLVPEDLVPVTKLGRMVLNRNVDNFFSETEQVTMHPGHLVNGIGITDDPLLQGRLFSYLDTQINRMNSANFMQLPINRPLNQVTNNQRDGFMQSNTFKGNVAYYPNALNGNKPELASHADGGYIEYPEEVNGQKQRGRPPSFWDFYSQARLYWNSLTPAEQQQTVDGFRFEVGKSKSVDVRRRFVDRLNQIDNSLARRVAIGVGVPLPEMVVENDGKTDSHLSIQNYPKPDNIRTRRVAILTAPGTNQQEAKSMYDYLTAEGAYPSYIGVHQGDQEGLNIDNTYVLDSSVLYDAIYIPGGAGGIDFLSESTSLFPMDEPKAFVMDAYRHGKPIAASSEGEQFFQAAVEGMTGVNGTDGIILGSENNIQESFKQALITQRFWSRLPIDQNI
ncbi:catalase-like domain-containing protein [Phascolomyces articulosus]|uniref:Catalase n=1 Tax=Phascolomyces articulosus TaxID=60185 RepID=A0AAD5K9C2_9FUNG|nr:catalase-like domain-containing protein [Phascolomyces articulosus]